MMKRLGLVLFAALLCATMAFGYKTGPVTFDQLIGTTNQTGLLVGDKVFYDFQYYPTFGCGGPGGSGAGCSGAPALPSAITVNGVGDGSNANPYSIEMIGGFYASATGYLPAYSDFLIKYTVETINGLPLINGIDQAYVGGVTSGLGTILINEIAYQNGYGLGPVAQSQLQISDIADPPGEPIQGDQLVINPPLNKVYVVKDIHLIAFAPCQQGQDACNAANTTSISYIRQSIHQVPEPGFYGMLALGLSGLVLAFRRRRTN